MLSIKGNIKEMLLVSEELKPMIQSGTKHALKVEGTLRRCAGGLGASMYNDTEIGKSEQKDAQVTRAQDGKNNCAPRQKGLPTLSAEPSRLSYQGEVDSGDQVGGRKGKSGWSPPNKMGDRVTRCSVSTCSPSTHFSPCNAQLVIH